MKKVNLTVMAAIIATFLISIIAFQPTEIEANNNVVPNMTPSPRKIRNVPAPTPSPITKIKAKKPINFGAGNQVESRRKQPRKRSTQKRQHMPCKDDTCK